VARRPGDRRRGQDRRAAKDAGADRPGTLRAPWFVSWVLDQLLDRADHRFDVLGTSRKTRTDHVFTGGLRITTTVDLQAQAAAERAVAAVAGGPAGTRTAPWSRSSPGPGGPGDSGRAQLVG
jgi:membrane peptidoglycan carboxypeptidase